MAKARLSPRSAEQVPLLREAARVSLTPSDGSSESIGQEPLQRVNSKPLIFSNLDDVTIRDSLPLPLWRKLMYAVGAMPYSMTNTVVGFYFNIFLLEVVIMDPTYVLIIVFAGRVWDAITDPVIGYLCTRTRTRFGRLRPWMISAAVPAGLVYLFLWFVPPAFVSDTEQPVKFLYYLCFYFAFQSLLTCIHVPYTALTMHLTYNIKERDSATLYRMVFEVLGTLLGILVYTVYFIGFVGEKEQDCVNGKRESDIDERRTYRYHALTCGVLLIVFVVTTFLGVREQKEEMRADKKIGFFHGIRETIGFRPYALLLLLELFSWLAIQFVQGNFALYVKYSVGLEDQYPYVIAVLLVSTIVWMPLWQLVIVKQGKKTAFFIGMWVFMPTLLLLLFVDFVPYLIYPLAIAGGLGVSAAYLLPWSMVPDVIDEAALDGDVRREELFYAFFVFGNKFASGVTLGISTGIYKMAGYDQDLCDQPWSVPLALKLLVTVPPILFILLSLFFLHYYPITERTRERTKTLLQERRKSKVKDGSPYVHRRNSISIPQWHQDMEKHHKDQQTNL